MALLLACMLPIDSGEESLRRSHETPVKLPLSLRIFQTKKTSIGSPRYIPHSTQTPHARAFRRRKCYPRSLKTTCIEAAHGPDSLNRLHDTAPAPCKVAPYLRSHKTREREREPDLMSSPAFRNFGLGLLQCISAAKQLYQVFAIGVGDPGIKGLGNG